MVKDGSTYRPCPLPLIGTPRENCNLQALSVSQPTEVTASLLEASFLRLVVSKSFSQLFCIQVELDLKEPLFFSPAAAGHLYIVKKNFYFHDTIRIGKFEGDFTSCLADVIKCACPLREDASWGQLGGPSGSLSLEADLVQSTFYNFP